MSNGATNFFSAKFCIFKHTTLIFVAYETMFNWKYKSCIAGTNKMYPKRMLDHFSKWLQLLSYKYTQVNSSD